MRYFTEVKVDYITFQTQKPYHNYRQTQKPYHKIAPLRQERKKDKQTNFHIYNINKD